MTLLAAVFNGPLVMLPVLVLLSLLLRWTFSERPHRARREPGDIDLGLLVAVATVRTTATAELIQGQLAGSGVRSTTTTTPDGHGLHILVFREDADKAEHLLTQLN